MNGLIITSLKQLHELCGFSPAEEFKRSHKVIRKAHKDKDLKVALHAAELNLKLADAFPEKGREAPDPMRPIAVQIVLSAGGATQALPADGEPFVLRALPPLVVEGETTC